MIQNLVIGGITIVVCVLIQCIVIAFMVQILILLDVRHTIKPNFLWLTTLILSVSIAMLFGNFLQITIWSGLFLYYGEFQEFATAFYHSVVNFSTLGYGDIVMSEERRLLGALEAANGVLMLGLTTSALFAIIYALARREREIQQRQVAKSDDPLAH